MIKRILAFLLFIISLQPLYAEVLEFKYKKGEIYRILSEVDEDVYLNGTLSHSAEILNRISVEITDTEGGRGLLSGVFQTSERSYARSSAYSLSEEYKSVFWRDEIGRYEIEDRYFMPVVRNVPLLPDRDLRPGDTWSGEGREVHDFRRGFGLERPFSFPVTVAYQYLGKDESGLYDLVSVKYSVFYKSDLYSRSSIYPVRVSGSSSQLIKWDNFNGRPQSYTEDFHMIFDLSSGDSVEYIGRSKGDVITASPLDRERVKDEIRSDLDSSGYNDVRVESVDEGVKIVIENIQFLPDSSDLVSSEKDKIRRIGEIIKAQKGRDILITGHTALAGTEEGREKLSLERAGAVAEYLLDLGVKTEKEITIQGKGADEPVADNTTETGKRKNRRVEITILEN